MEQSERGSKYLLITSLGALGVVFGDIGTSPLYAFRESFLAAEGLAVNEESVLVMVTWKTGRERLTSRIRSGELTTERFIGSISAHPQRRVPGTGVYLFSNLGATPPPLLANLRHNEGSPRNHPDRHGGVGNQATSPPGETGHRARPRGGLFPGPASLRLHGAA